MTPDPDRPGAMLIGATILTAVYIGVLVIAWWWNR